MDNAKLKIALLTDGVTPYVTGGMQRHSYNLAKYLTISGVSVTLVHCVAAHNELPSEEQVNKDLFGDTNHKLDGVVGFHFPAPGKLPGHYIRNSYQYSKQIFEKLDFSIFDFIYAKGFTGWYYMEQKEQRVELPPIGVKFHGYEMFQELPSFTQKLKAKILRKPVVWNNEHADFIFSYGGKITSLILNIFKVKSEQILEFPSGINASWINEDFQEAVNKPLRFVFVGRYERRKGVEELTQVLTRLCSERSDFEVDLIGPIPEDKKIASENVTYHGLLQTKEEICKVLDQSDVLLCPSHSEGMPNVILEGMARGNAILATIVGAVECLVNEDCGWLINPADASALYEQMVQILDGPEAVVSEKKKSAYNRVSVEYNWESLALSIKETVLNLVEK